MSIHKRFRRGTVVRFKSNYDWIGIAEDDEDISGKLTVRWYTGPVFFNVRSQKYDKRHNWALVAHADNLIEVAEDELALFALAKLGESDVGDFNR
jgi:hypothetical protein